MKKVLFLVCITAGACAQAQQSELSNRFWSYCFGLLGHERPTNEAGSKQKTNTKSQELTPEEAQMQALSKLVELTENSHQQRIQQIWAWPQMVNPTKEQCKTALEDSKKEYDFYERHLFDILRNVEASGADLNAKEIMTQKRQEFNEVNKNTYEKCLKQVTRIQTLINQQQNKADQS